MVANFEKHLHNTLRSNHQQLNNSVLQSPSKLGTSTLVTHSVVTVPNLHMILERHFEKDSPTSHPHLVPLWRFLTTSVTPRCPWITNTNC